MPSTQRTAPDSGATKLPRILGAYGTGPGPLLVLIAGMHGNEPAGVIAVERVFETLRARSPQITGRVVAIAGNVAALENQVRYFDQDLNRLWTKDEVSKLRDGEPHRESFEQREIVRALVEEFEQRPEDVYLLDLHTTSALGSPFTIINDTLRNRRIAFALNVPVILGLEENLQGTLLDYLGDYGCSTLGLEGGQHDHAETPGNHEAAIWITLVTAGLIAEAAVPGLDSYRKRLATAAEGQPRVVDIQHREEIQPGAEFTMLPGFENFQGVRAGELLAHCKAPGDQEASEVRTATTGVVIMPRYQGQGSDGFFIGRRVQRFWVWLSGLLRRLKLSRVVAWLPGIKKTSRKSDFLEVNRKIARLFPIDVLHLLGYRYWKSDSEHLVFTRRVERKPDLDRLIAEFREILQ